MRRSLPSRWRNSGGSESEETIKYYIDTEFIERGHEYPLELISLALVAEDGREFYAVNLDFDPTHAGPWVREHVLPLLPYDTPALWRTRAQIRDELLAFLGSDQMPVFWAYFADYDWVIFCQLFGTMVELPSHFPHYCLDLIQLMGSLKVRKEELPAQVGVEHDALRDARWLKAAHEHLLLRFRGIL